MKVLIIDDSDYKVVSLQALLKNCAFVSEVTVARSFQSGVHSLAEFSPDLVLLDMTLPTSERPDGELEGRTRIYGGRHVLAEMMFEGIKSKVIIVTQFDRFDEPPMTVDLETLLKQLQSEYPDLVVGGVYYNPVDSSWQKQLRMMLERVHSK